MLSVHAQISRPAQSVLRQCIALALASLASATFARTVAVTREQPLTPINTLDEPRHLNTRGPYRFVRHPFYSSYLLNFTAGAVGSEAATSCLVLLVVSYNYIRAAKEEEAKFAESTLAIAYNEYRTETHMLVPWLI